MMTHRFLFQAPQTKPCIRGAFGLAGALVVVLSGCAGKPWGNARLESEKKAVAGFAPEIWTALGVGQEAAAEGWLLDFGNEELIALVKEAQSANPDLKAAAARVDQARQDVRVVTADLLPTLDGSGNASRAQRPGDQRFPGLGQRANRFTLSADIAWEPDFWGQIRDERRASVASFAAGTADYHAARLSLAANTVKAAFTAAEAEAQVALAAENVSTRKIQQQLLEKALDRGLDPERAALDVSLGRADLARAESELTSQQRALDGARRSLEGLLGRYPAGRVQVLKSLPEPRRQVPAGLPATLLTRRPDVLAAEQRLFASLNQESAAWKALLPGIRLTGDKGYSTQTLADLITVQSAVWTLASGVTQPLFQGGRLQAGAKRARARYDELLNSYAATAQTAFREVETGLAAERFLVEQQEQLARAAVEAERSEVLALGQYERGLVDVLTLLDSRQRAYDAKRALTSARALRLRNRADLYLALGGAFDS
jgi:NodT family efflux transporter outer membrane factor (OMF) lipoprotein